MSAFQAVHEKRYDFIDGLASLGGRRDHTAPTIERCFSARYTTDPGLQVQASSMGINLVAEILAAVMQEISLELVLKLLDEAEKGTQGGPPARSGSETMRRVDAAADAFEPSLIVMSPTALVVPQVLGLNTRSHKEYLTNRLLGLHYRGRRGQHAIVVNQYAMDTHPVMICAPGWFTFRYDRVLWWKSGLDPNTMEPTTRFYTDIETDIDFSRVAKVAINLNSWWEM